MRHAGVHFLISLFLLFISLTDIACLKITPKPCSNVVGEEGTCMFVWECIRINGKRLGTCVDGYLFGSCCGHNETLNAIHISSSFGSSTTPSFAPQPHLPASSPSTSINPQTSYTHLPSHPAYAASGSTIAWPEIKPSSPPTESSSSPSSLSSPSSSHWPTHRPVASPHVSVVVAVTAVTSPPQPDPDGTSVSHSNHVPRPPNRHPSAGPSPSSQQQQHNHKESQMQSSLPSSSSLPPSSSPSSLSLPPTASSAAPTPKSSAVQKPTSSPVQSPLSGSLTAIGSQKWSSQPPQPSSVSVTTPASIKHTSRPLIFSTSTTHRPPAAAAAASSTPQPVTTPSSECGLRRMGAKGRIVGGTQSKFSEWPWLVSLRQWKKNAFLHKCGAALLNNYWAVTAAHCVENVAPNDLLLRLGEYDVSHENEPYPYVERRVQIIAPHPEFDPRTFEYDLALLRFYEPVHYRPNIIPVCIPSNNNETYVGKQATVAGWGRLYEDGPLPDTLQHVDVPVITNKECETMYRKAGYIEEIPSIFICAGLSKGARDSCEGDSGGPLVLQNDGRWELIGIISWGIGCALPNQPGVYTRITEFSAWINQIIAF